MAKYEKVTPGGERTVVAWAEDAGVCKALAELLDWNGEGEWSPTQDPVGIGDMSKDEAKAVVACLVQLASLNNEAYWIPVTGKASKTGTYLGLWPSESNEADEPSDETAPLYWCVCDAPFHEGDEAYGGIVDDGVSMYAQCVDWSDAGLVAEGILEEIEREESN